MARENKEIKGATESMFAGDITFMDCERFVDAKTIPQFSIVVLGIPFDGSTSNRPGTRFGPRAIRIASKMLSWQKVYDWDYELYGQNVKKQKIKVGDLGDLVFDYGKIGNLIFDIRSSISAILKKNSKPLIIGGDHSISYPILKTIFEKKCSLNNKIALIHFDAHSDTWEDEPGRIDHGTGFYHAIKEGIIDPKHSIQIGIRTSNEKNFGIKVISPAEVMKLSFDQIAKQIIKRVAKHPVYLTFDIDVLDPAYAPGTGTPVVGGLSTFQILSILKRLQPIKFLGADLVEVSPPFDHGEITALAGATIASYLGHLLAKF
jgi:agmatinase